MNALHRARIKTDSIRKAQLEAACSFACGDPIGSEMTVPVLALRLRNSR